MRGIWSGTIGFGMVSIPVKLYTAIGRSPSLSRMCKKCNSQIGNVYRCKSCKDEPEFGNWNSGYKLDKENYMVVDKDKVDGLKKESQDTIPIVGFVGMDEFSPLWESGDKYFVGIAEKKKSMNVAARTAYVLLKTVLDHQLVAVGKLTMRGREALVSIRSYRGGLIVTKMVYHEQLRDEEEVFFATEQITIEPDTLQLASKMIEKLNGNFDYAGFKDEYIQSLMELLNGEPVEIPEMNPAIATDNLQELLKASVAGT